MSYRHPRPRRYTYGGKVNKQKALLAPQPIAPQQMREIHKLLGKLNIVDPEDIAVVATQAAGRPGHALEELTYAEGVRVIDHVKSAVADARAYPEPPMERDFWVERTEDGRGYELFYYDDFE
jgi:hypothetical protein